MQYNTSMMTPSLQQSGVADLAIRDVQRRLEVLGYDLGDEAQTSQYGEKTAAAVSAFKMRTELPPGEMLDQATWIALVDASLMPGERVLYLHQPPFHGRDVQVLQGALSALGFTCNLDGVFDATTEYAVRDFQCSMALIDNGIVDIESLDAIRRLRHAWEGKLGARIEGRIPRFIRSIEVLKNQPICVYGTTKFTRSLAERISNLAHATTSEARVVSASSLSRAPGRDVFIVGLLEEEGTAEHVADMTLEGILREAVSAVEGNELRITLNTAPMLVGLSQRHLEQHCAVILLDALCSVLSQF